jgi:hypothetical protein
LPLEPLNLVGDELHAAARELALELYGLPLTLSLVGRYLRMTGSRVQDYLFDIRTAPAPSYLPPSTDKHVIKAFVMAYEQTLRHIQEVDQPAFKCLQMAALFLPEDIPNALFLSPQEQAATENEDTHDESQLNRLIPALSEFACFDTGSVL